MITLDEVNARDVEWAIASRQEALAHKTRDQARDTYFRQELARLGFTIETVCRAKYGYNYRWTGELITDAPAWLDGRIVTWMKFRALRKDGEFHNGISSSRLRVMDVLEALEDGREVPL